MNAHVLFHLMCYVSATIGYLLRWSYGEQKNLVLLFWALSASMFYWTFIVEKNWRWRFVLLTMVSLLWGMAAAHWAFRTYPHPLSSMELLFFAAFIPVVPRLILLQLPSGDGKGQEVAGVVYEIGWFRKATIVSGVMAAIGIFMFLDYWLDGRAILYRGMIGFFLFIPATFAAGWVFHRGYLKGWEDAKKTSSGTPAPLDVRGRARLILFPGGKTRGPSESN